MKAAVGSGEEAFMKLSLLVPAFCLIAAPVLAHPQRPDGAHFDRPGRVENMRNDRPQAERPRAERSDRATRDAAPGRSNGTDRAATGSGGTPQHDNLCKKGDCTSRDRSEEK
jgi:hypothetical protein